MDIQAEKLKLIQWLTEINDPHIIEKLRGLQKSLDEKGSFELTEAEKKAIDEALNSIMEGNVKSHEEVMEATKKKYPHLFK